MNTMNKFEQTMPFCLKTDNIRTIAAAKILFPAGKNAVQTSLLQQSRFFRRHPRPLRSVMIQWGGSLTDAQCFLPY